MRHAGTWLLALPAAIAIGCGNSPSPAVDPDAAPEVPDAAVVECLAAPRPAPLPMPERVSLPAGRTMGGGPVALPRPASRPLPSVAVPRPARTGVRLAGIAERVAQRTLVLSAVDDEPAYGAARAALERIGVPFETHVATTSPFTSLRLFEDDGTCRYSSIILSTDMLAFYDEPNDQWISALSEPEWEMISSYETVCGAREAIWYA
jgi:hypothetical protein